MKLLVVEDDASLAEAIAHHLSTQHYLVEIAPDGEAGLQLVKVFEYDLILLDLHLPTLDGIQFCQQLRAMGKVLPVLLMTAEDSQSKKVEGLDAGADDYVIKPLDLKELAARIRALLRRGYSSPSLLQWGVVSLNPSNCEVFCQQQRLSLTAKEYEILELFLRHPRRIFSLNILIEQIWSMDKLPSDSAVRSHIKSLRRKLKQDGVEDMIETVYGLGYRLRENPNPHVEKPLGAPSATHSAASTLQLTTYPEVSKAFPGPHSTTSLPNATASHDTDDGLDIHFIWQQAQSNYWDMVKDLEQTVGILKIRSLAPDGPDGSDGPQEEAERGCSDDISNSPLGQEDLDGQTLSSERWERSRRYAHTLKGALGCFGCMEGSQLAAQIEQYFSCARDESIPVKELSDLITQLRHTLHELSRVPDGENKQDAQQQQKLREDYTQQPTINPLPQEDVLPQHPRLAQEKEPSGYWLIIETDQTLVQALMQQAPLWNTQLQVVETPLAAQQWLDDRSRQRPAQSSILPYGVTLDVVMPDVVMIDPNCAGSLDDGLTFIAELTQQFPQLPVIVATDEDTLGHRVNILRSGSYAFLPKPVNASQMLEAVSHCLARTTLPTSRILALDDDPGILLCLHDHLTPWGFQLTVLSTAIQFWDALEHTTPDLILLDIEMPDLNGLELCRVIRNDPKLSQVPILILSAQRTPNTVHQVFEAGADDYLNKPIIGSELVARILNRLERVQLLRTLAETDDLTGLTRRKKSVEDLNKLLKLAERQHTTLCFAVLDLDQFKQVNDRYGHDMGDRVLKIFGDYLRQTFRSEDIIARWGGEEFIVCLYNVSKAIARQRLTLVLKKFYQHRFQTNQHNTFHVSFSAGVAAYPEDGHDIHSLYTRADALLYQAKAAGRNQITIQSS